MRLILVLVLVIITFNAVAEDKKAITDNGDVVILKSNGTWTYESEIEEVKLTENSQNFIKEPDSTFKLKSSTNNSAFWLNPKKWSFKKNNDSAAIEYNLYSKGSDLYGMIITESIEIKLEELVNIAFSTAQSAAPNMKVIKKEYRNVNGLKVIYMEMQGTVKSMEITYFGYYYSDAESATQYLAYTGSKLVEKHKIDIAKFLNGIDVQ
ncbi:hypothetical protein GCM10008107_19350 [Psychrosphaera saromensis]|uniref:DUF4340 domain-containing protein n=1 Tax=Psychrosphaera saromensis TaxID=716813 RepID=A0A2S7UTN7_9GAMM|nr:hypothetical protein [Psychrosphaera saromensis]PQJ52640.1 hypothetical protein BTO11_02560 [Psychrosphaera saromensis]GHB70123.1 hypothetical protein GCM10008107_19350 [Psychrosphaera saromensis]GLQ13120.1 hypothetical protein GCM10007917_05750 [Psychrosphaera saromensis]